MDKLTRCLPKLGCIGSADDSVLEAGSASESLLAHWKMAPRNNNACHDESSIVELDSYFLNPALEKSASMDSADYTVSSVEEDIEGSVLNEMSAIKEASVCQEQCTRADTTAKSPDKDSSERYCFDVSSKSVTSNNASFVGRFSVCGEANSATVELESTRNHHHPSTVGPSPQSHGTSSQPQNLLLFEENPRRKATEPRRKRKLERRDAFRGEGQSGAASKPGKKRQATACNGGERERETDSNAKLPPALTCHCPNCDCLETSPEAIPTKKQRFACSKSQLEKGSSENSRKERTSGKDSKKQLRWKENLEEEFYC